MKLNEQEKLILEENLKILTNERLPNEPIPTDSGQNDLYRIRRKLQNDVIKAYKKGASVHKSTTIDFQEVDGEIRIVRKGITYVKQREEDSEESSEL